MKRLPTLCVSGSMLLGISFGANAANVDLMVSGSIAPAAACDVSIGSAALDLGTINRAALNPDPSKPTHLEEQRVLTSVICTHARRFAFVVTDAGGSNAADPLAFELHGGENHGKPGNLFLKFDTQSTKIDNKQGYATGSSNGVIDLGDATWGPATPPTEDLPITNGRYAVGFVNTPGSTDTPVPMKTLSVYLLVDTEIKPVNDLDLSADIAFTGDLGLEIRYF